MAEKSATDEQLGRLARRQNEVFRRVREGSLPADFALSELQRIIEFHEAEHVDLISLSLALERWWDGLDIYSRPTARRLINAVQLLQEELIRQERSMNDDIWEVTARAEKAEAERNGYKTANELAAAQAKRFKAERDIYLKALERIRALVPSDRHHKVEDVEALDLIANEVRAALNQQEEK